MPEYVQVQEAGNKAAANAFRVVFETADHSDIPQLTAWDNENMNTTSIECLAGTPGNGNESMVMAVSTNDGNAAPAEGWATGLVSQSGGAVANRLRGRESFVLLGTTPPMAPFPVHRTFQYAMACAADSHVGSIGYRPAIACKVFYTGAPPVVNFDFNAGTEEDPDWQRMTSQAKGSAMAIGVGNTIHATGPDTVGGDNNDGVLDPVTKPGAGEKVAEGYWVRTL